MKLSKAHVLCMSAVVTCATVGCAPPMAPQTIQAAQTDGAAADRVIAGPPSRKTLTLYTSQPARMAAYEETPLVPKVAGYVDQVLVDIGDRVKKDQAVLRLSVPELQDELKQKEALVALAEAELKQAQASVAAVSAAAASERAKVSVAEAGMGRADAELARSESEHARIKELSANGSVTRKLLDETVNQLRAAEATRREVAATVESATASFREAQVNIQKAEADVVAASARLNVARANLGHTQTMLSYTVIKAPYDGVVTSRAVDSGHYVQPATGASGKPMLVVMRTDKIRASTDVPELESPLVDVGDSATLRIQSLAGKEVEAQISRLSWSLGSSNRSLRVELDLDNAAGQFRPGMFATVTILLDQRENVLTLPAAAIVRDGGKTLCCAVVDGKIKRIPVELGLRSGDDIEIISGLDARQQVVLIRPESLREGQAVQASAATK